MRKQFVVYILLIFWMSLLAGCASTGTGQRAAPPEGSGRERDVNAYYLYSQAHLKLKQGDLDAAIEFMNRAVAQDPNSTYLKRELAGYWLMKKEAATALQLLDDILVNHPDDVEALVLSGRIHQSINQPQPAIESYSRAIAIDPSRQDIYLQLGRMYTEQEQWEQARQVYEKLVQNHPQSYAGYFFLGRISAADGDTKAAQAYFSKTLSLQPDLLEPRFELAGMYEDTRHYAKAAATYKDILGRSPGNRKAKMGLGYALYRQGQKKKAQAIFAELGRLSREDPEVIRTLVGEYLDTRRYQEAAVIIDGMRQSPESHQDLDYLSGVTLDGLGKKREALRQLKKIGPDSRFFQNARVHVALIYQEMEKPREAIASLQDAIEKDPDNPEYYVYVGSLYEQVEEYARAEQALLKGIDMDADNARLFFRLGVVYDKWGRKEDSIAAMKQTIALEPEDANALNYLGYTYADMGINLDEAERLVRKALEQKPGDGYITDSLAWIYYRRGQYEKALPLLQQAVAAVPDDPVIREHLGDVYRALGKIEAALENYRQSLDLGHTEPSSIQKKIDSLSK